MPTPRQALSFALLLLLLPLHCVAATAPVFGYQVVARLPHSTSSYTEGLFFLDGLFYEGTGLNGQSALMAIDPATGRPVQQVALPAQYFGEGIINWGSTLYQWTWQSHLCFVYDRVSFRLLRQFSYTGEGWGMTRTTTQIITSDGSATLRFRDPATFGETRHIIVHDAGHPVDQLNELEYIQGQIYANVWHSNRIARISPRDGRVLSWIDLAGLLPDSLQLGPEAVLNGIAYDALHDRLFVTGKQWPAIFQVKVNDRPNPR